MRIAVLGGTRFIGPAIVRTLEAAGHQVAVVHRGTTEAESLPPSVQHVHLDVTDVSGCQKALNRFMPQVCIDIASMTRADALARRAAVPPDARIVVISSCDVYQASLSLALGMVTDALPITESSPLRDKRYVWRDRVPGVPNYEKLDVEDVWRRFGATTLRLPAVYGDGDYVRREDAIIRRVLMRQSPIPFGPGNLLYSRISVDSVADCVVAVIDSKADLSNEVFNVAESETLTIELWARVVAAAVGVEFQPCLVAPDAIPIDLKLSRLASQHLQFSSEKATRILAWQPRPAVTTLSDAVARHYLRAFQSRAAAERTPRQDCSL